MNNNLFYINNKIGIDDIIDDNISHTFFLLNIKQIMRITRNNSEKQIKKSSDILFNSSNHSKNLLKIENK